MFKRRQCLAYAVPNKHYNAIRSDWSQKNDKFMMTRTQNRRGQRAFSFNVCFVEIGSWKNVSPVRVRSASMSDSFRGERPWYRANEPPSPVRCPRMSTWQSFGCNVHDPLTFASSKRQNDKGLKWRQLRYKLERVWRTYFIRGSNVIDQMIALIPPMTSSWEGTGPELGQIPFRT